MINKNFLQATTMAKVVQAGWAADGEFYVHGVVNNPTPVSEKDQFLNVLVRLPNEEERTAFFAETRGLTQEQAELDAYIVGNRQRKTIDVAGQFTAKINDAKSNGHFAKVSDKEIFENHLGGTMVALHGVSITHKLKNDTISVDPDDLSQNLHIAVADKIVVTGMVKDRAYLGETLGSEVADEEAVASNTMARFVLSPPEDGRAATVAAYEVTDAENINFKQLALNPTKMDRLIDQNARPFHQKVDSFHRQGFLEMNVSYEGKLHRFSFDQGTLDGGEHQHLNEEDLINVSKNWQGHDGEHQHDISRFRAMQDPDTIDELSKAHLAKLDFMRVILLASQEPKKFQGFMDKLNNNDPTAFNGITKTDFLNEPNLLPEQKTVLDITKALAKNPEKVFINASTHNKLNISAKLEEAMTDHMAASYAKANKGLDGVSSNQYGKSSSAQSNITNSSLDVVKLNNYGDVYTIVIPIVKVTEVHPKGQYAAISDQVHAVHKAVPNVNWTISDNGTSRYTKNNVSYQDDNFVPVSLVKAANKPIDFVAVPAQNLLKGEKPAPTSINVKNNALSNSIEEYVNYDVGRADLNANYAPNKIEIASVQQANFAYPKLAFKDSFVKLMEQRQADPTPAIKRFDEMTEVVKQIVGGFSKENNSNSVYKAVLSQNPADRDDKTNKIRDMLLGDQLVEVEIPDKTTGEMTLKKYNFSDVVAVTLNADKPLRRAIKDDVTDKLADLNQDDFNKFKSERLNQTSEQIIEKLQASTMTLDDFCDEAENLKVNQSPTPSPSLRA